MTWKWSAVPLAVLLLTSGIEAAEKVKGYSEYRLGEPRTNTELFTLLAQAAWLPDETVDTYRQRAMEKLNLEHRSDVIRFALQAGLLDDIHNK